MSKTGGCLCGQVRYEATTAPLMSGVCHCKNCQKQAGTAFSTLAAFQKSDVDFVGELKLYQDGDTDTGCIETQPSATSSPPFLPPPSGLAYSVKHARAARGRWQTGRSVCSHSFH